MTDKNFQRADEIKTEIKALEIQRVIFADLQAAIWWGKPGSVKYILTDYQQELLRNETVNRIKQLTLEFVGL